MRWCVTAIYVAIILGGAATACVLRDAQHFTNGIACVAIFAVLFGFGED
jgi:hypothetical protein